MIERLISGGQMGVDRAALDLALARGLPCGGICPRGRRAEDGRIADRYPLTEARFSAYWWRTVGNVWQADATLVITRGAPAGGTRLTVRAARCLGRSLRVVDMAAPGFDPEVAAAQIRQWLDAAGVRSLNVAGPRESQAPGIYDQVAALLERVIGNSPPHPLTRARS